MPGHEKLLKKVEQDRVKGQLDRALARLKEAIVAEPRDFFLAREAATLAFEMGRTLDGAGIVRAAMKRCPNERAAGLEMLEREFASGKQLELAELLYDSYLSTADLDRARDVVLGLAEADRNKLLAKLRAKLQSVTEDAPNDAPRIVGLLLAVALTLSAMQRSAEVAVALQLMLETDAKQVDTIGRLCKLELRQSPTCAKIHLLLARCYVNVDKPQLAAEHIATAGRQDEFRTAALELAESAGTCAAMQLARAELLLREGRFEPGRQLLDALLTDDNGAETAVRHVLESVPGATEALAGLRLTHARTLACTGATRLAYKELLEAQEAGADPADALVATSQVLEHDAQNTDLHLLRARLATAAKQPEVAAEAYQKALQLDPTRAEKLREEIEAACKSTADAALGRVVVDLYLQLQMPSEASEALRRLSTSRSVAPAVLYELSGNVASQYGLSASLLTVFVQSAIQTDHDREARAAVAHYLSSPGVRLTEFGQLLTTLLRERADLAARLSRVLEGLALPADLRFMLATSALEGAGAEQALVELEALVMERPGLRETALVALEAYLARSGDVVEALLLAADLCQESGRIAPAARHVARALRAAPEEADRICKIADAVLRRDPSQSEAWSEIVFALIDSQRHRHARELCYLAVQALPPEKQGFVHTALGQLLLDAKQMQQAVRELETALGCDDAPIDRVVATLERVIEVDAKHGYARFVLAAALLRQEGEAEGALVQLSAAVQHDDLLVDPTLDLLTEHAQILAQHAAARALEGMLRLRKGDRQRGVALLDQALAMQPDLAPQVVQRLESEWDRDSQNFDLGLAFARALRGTRQVRRACRLCAELGKRFPKEQGRLIAELETLIEAEPLAEAHRALWEIQLQGGNRQAALHHLSQAVAAPELDDAGRVALLEAANRQLPDTAWIVCRLAELEASAERPRRVEELLRPLLHKDPGAWQTALESLRASKQGLKTPELRLLEVDCLLAGHRGAEVLESLRRFRDEFPQVREATVARYRVLAAQNSAGATADLELGMLLKEHGQVDDAVGVLEAAVQKLASRVQAGGDVAEVTQERELRLALASLYVELGREREGKELLSSVLDRPGDHQEAYGFLERLARQGLLGKLKNLRETIAGTPTNLRARLELARLSIVSLDFEGARGALSFTGDSPVVEAARRYLLARSYADDDQPQLAIAILRSLALDDVGDAELRRNIVYMKAVCAERVGDYGESHALFLQLLSEFPYFKDTRERARITYQKHLETALETRAAVLEKRTHLDMV